MSVPHYVDLSGLLREVLDQELTKERGTEGRGVILMLPYQSMEGMKELLTLCPEEKIPLSSFGAQPVVLPNLYKDSAGLETFSIENLDELFRSVLPDLKPKRR